MTCARDAFWEAAGRGWWVEPVSAVEYRCAPEWHVLPRTIGDYMLWYVRGGVGILAMAGQEYPLRAGDVLFVAPGVTHSAAHDPARPLWTITTHFTFRNTEGEVLTPPSDALPPVRRSTGEPHVFDAYFARLLTLEALRPSGWQAIARAVLLAVLTELRRENVQATITPALGHGEYSAIAEALLRLEAEGTYFTAPGTLARACGFSPGYFSRLFRRQFGRTPQQYLITRRMERARHLLLESDLSVEQVARSLGYHDVFFFTRQFKAHIGQPPAAFRRAARLLT